MNCSWMSVPAKGGKGFGLVTPTVESFVLEQSLPKTFPGHLPSKKTTPQSHANYQRSKEELLVGLS